MPGTTEDLIAGYRIAAAKHGEASQEGNAGIANKAYDDIASIYRELRNRRPDERHALLRLLEDANPSVRSWAAGHALEFAPERGEPVLEALTSTIGVAALSARYTLSEWRKGAQKFL